MYLLKAIVLIMISIGVWIIAPIAIALASTAIAIIVVRYILKEHADVTRQQQQHQQNF